MKPLIRPIVLNGPQFRAQVLGKTAMIVDRVKDDGLRQGAEEMADEWRSRVPVEEGHYRESIKVDHTVEATDAVSYIYPGRVAGVPDDEQPFRYAGVLEYGGVLTQRQRGSFIPPQPSARPAYDSKKERVIAEVAIAVRRAV